MADLHVLAGEGANPASAPTENASSEESSKKPGNGVLEATAQHPNAGENQAAEADHGPGIDGEGLEGCHQRCCPGEVHRSLGMRNVCCPREGESNECRPHHTSYMEQFLSGKGLSQSLG